MQKDEPGVKRCPQCGKKTIPIKECKCGGVKGGSGSGAGEEQLTNTDSMKAPTSDKATRPATPVFTPAVKNKDWTQFLNADEKMLNMLRELQKFLLISENIDENKNLGILTIKCRGDYSALTREQKFALDKFFQTIGKEFKDFKKENNPLDKNCTLKFEKDKFGNVTSLILSIADLALYNKFIKQSSVLKFLVIPKAAPQQGKEKQESETHNVSEKHVSKHFPPKPLSTNFTKK